MVESPTPFYFQSYDLKTEYRISSIEIPEGKLEAVRSALRLDHAQWIEPSDLPLSAPQARRVGEIPEIKIDGAEAYYFIGH